MKNESSPSRPVALITGGSRGIGLGIATHLARAGFDVAINGMRPAEAVREVVSELEKLGAAVLYCQGDIGDKDARTQILRQVRERFGRLHCLVNNAGVAPKERKDILEATEESFEYVIKVNLQGPYFLTQAAANWMIEQKKADPDFFGCIVNVGSISATVASVNRGEYCLAKAGIGMATQLWATRLGEFDLPVYEVRPGVTKTDMTAGVAEKYDKLIAEGLCVTKRWGFPEDVGKAVTALARGDFPYSTGQVIMIDGGLTIARL
jgi:3-oxoacyl-[acyl-carrier protein] reductase